MKTLLLGLVFAANAWATPPSRLLIEHHQWQVVEVKTLRMDGEKLDGFTSCFARQITLRQRDPSAEAETLVHEVLHAVTCEHRAVHNELWNNSTGDEHHGIYRMSPRLYRVLAQNPELLRYLRDSATPEEVTEP